eukprot:CAMPEP_0182439818 /NCGR_PEP_ID=MMETSP1167-20130531/86670_1 /TAXON_ID=2988 /ORGANISM="Mallomonas Sp, Strain CCMP3275" /LENGTH=1314 /DNA_ID=CAMNT_0024633607 /DNA_START=1523 /DNA_END=5467 /DNA_ORIENTATION=-
MTCSPWCQSDGDWLVSQSPGKQPRCVDDQDMVMRELEQSLHVIENLNFANIVTLSIVMQSRFPYDKKALLEHISYDHAVQYSIELRNSTELCASMVYFCGDSECTEVFGVIEGTYWKIPPQTKSLIISRGDFYIKVIPVTTLDCTLEFGYQFSLNIVINPIIGWKFSDLPYLQDPERFSSMTTLSFVEDFAHNQIPSENFLVSESTVTSPIYAQGLCQTEWRGVMCEHGRIVGLSLRSTSLYGTLPTTIGLLSTLRELDLSGNRITGSIPSTLGLLTNLRKLILANNGLSNEVPSELNSLTSIVWIDLASNILIGSVPQFLEGLTDLRILSLDENKFEGEVPANLCRAVTEQNMQFRLKNNPDITCYQEECWKDVVDVALHFGSTLGMCVPTFSPTTIPSVSPSSHPSGTPTHKPTPTSLPSSSPSLLPSFSPSTDPTFQPTKAVFIVQPVLNQRDLIIVCVLCSVTALAVLLFFIHKKFFSEKAITKRKIRRALKTLPVHRALLDPEPTSEPDMLRLIEVNLNTVNKKDFTGRTALDIILVNKKANPRHSNVVYRLLLEALPVNPSTGEVLEDEDRTYGWTQAVQMDEDDVVSAVERILVDNRQYVEILANVEDSAHRKCIDIAGPRCKAAIVHLMYLFERYELRQGHPEHRSATSLVIFATDHIAKGHEKSHVVALKFMKHRDQFLKEVEIRAESNFNETFVLSIITKYDGDADDMIDREFREDAIRKGFSEYSYCVVMEAANQNLKRIIDHENIVGSEWNTIRDMTKNLAGSLDHIHGKGIIHGDLKPLNVLMVGMVLKLTDLDAAASFIKGELVGTKYSSGYIPPEMLFEEENGMVKVRTIHDSHGLIAAHPSQDMWALGCVLYFLCAGCTLFHVNTEDNIMSADDFSALYRWEGSFKQKKLEMVKDKFARNLLALLLTRNADKRPTAARVLSHPFVTGQRASRLQGEGAQWDVFLSYRVSSDSDHVEMIYNALIAKGLKVWWDKLCLLPGQNWEEGFCSGLVSSAFFVCLLSRGAIKNPKNDAQNWEKLTETSRCDNVVLEWRLALELKERGMTEGIFPVMIGDKDEKGIYSIYSRSGCNPSSPDIVIESVEKKLREHLEREGLGLPFIDTCSVKTIHTSVLANQGCRISGDLLPAIDLAASSIYKMTKSVSKSQQALQPIKTAISKGKFVAAIKLLQAQRTPFISDKGENLKHENEKILSINNNLRIDNNELKSKVNQLQINIENVKTEILDITMEMNDMKQSYEQIKNEYHSEHLKNDELCVLVSSLQSKIMTLEQRPSPESLNLQANQDRTVPEIINENDIETGPF